MQLVERDIDPDASPFAEQSRALRFRRGSGKTGCSCIFSGPREEREEERASGAWRLRLSPESLRFGNFRRPELAWNA